MLLGCNFDPALGVSSSMLPGTALLRRPPGPRLRAGGRRPPGTGRAALGPAAGEGGAWEIIIGPESDDDNML